MAARHATRVNAKAAKTPWHRVLHVQPLDAIGLGGVVGRPRSNLATHGRVKAPGDGFIKPTRQVIAPVIFCAGASGIAHSQDARTVGRIGVTAFIHFEIVSTFAFTLGPAAGNLARPGARFGGAMADAQAVAN